jgi:HEAT repeat protein
MKFNPGMTDEQIVALAKSTREEEASSQAGGGAIEKWIAKLTDENSPLHHEAAVELGQAGSAAVPGLIHVLQTEKRAPVRLEALEALKTIGYRASAAVPALADMAAGAGPIAVQRAANRTPDRR